MFTIQQALNSFQPVSSTAMDALHAIHSACNKVVPFNPEWHNGTGYLNGITDAELGLRPGEVAKSTDDLNRKIVIICGGDNRQVAIFQRYSHGERDYVVSNTPSGITYVRNPDTDKLATRQANVWYEFEHKTDSTSNLSCDSIVKVLQEIEKISAA